MKFESQEQRRRYAAQIASNINSIEGVPVPTEADRVSDLWIQGEISGSEMMAKLAALFIKAPQEGYHA